MNDLYHLAYISKSMLGENPGFIREEVAAILEASRRNNAKRHVTGALLYSGGYFCQILEGPQSEIKATFDQIELDDRHEDVEILFFDPAPVRAFGIWSMAHACREVDKSLYVPMVKQSADQVTCLQLGKQMVGMLNDLLQKKERTVDLIDEILNGGSTTSQRRATQEKLLRAV